MANEPQPQPTPTPAPTPQPTPQPQPTPAPASDDLTPAEEAKFSKFFSKLLVDNDNAPSPAPTQGGSIRDVLRDVLNERDQARAKDDTITRLTTENEELKKAQSKPKKWSPWSPLGNHF